MTCRRRGFLVAVGLALLAAPLAAEAQPAAVSRIGFLSGGTRLEPVVQGFRQGLREHGYVEDQNALIEWRFAEGRVDHLPGLTRDLVARKVDAIVTVGLAAALAAKKATGTIPIVFTVISDPVAAGLVPSLARPGGNVTGITNLGAELSGKRLELLKDALPALKRVVVPVVRAEPTAAPAAKESETAGRQLGLTVRLVDVGDLYDLQGAFDVSARERGVVCLLPSAFLAAHRAQIVEFAARARVPLLAWVGEFAESGALMSYGPNHFEIGRRGAEYADRILRGAKPADLPVEQPTKFELVLNLKTAKALGLTFSPPVLRRADRVIE
jgi:putative ABC transport system substrate-binding protein